MFCKIQIAPSCRFLFSPPIFRGKIGVFRACLTKVGLVQVDSHRSLAEGVTNEKNYRKDISGLYVLISKHFWYFGEDAPQIPDKFENTIVKIGIGYKKVIDKNVINTFITWLLNNYETGYNGIPYLFKGDFKRYNGN